MKSPDTPGRFNGSCGGSPRLLCGWVAGWVCGWVWKVWPVGVVHFMMAPGSWTSFQSVWVLSWWWERQRTARLSGVVSPWGKGVVWSRSVPELVPVVVRRQPGNRQVRSRALMYRVRFCWAGRWWG